MLDVVKRRWRRILLIVVGVWLLSVAALVGTAYGDVTKGRDQLLALRDDFSAADLDSGNLDTQLAEATSSLQRGHDKLDNPLVAPFRLVPFAGRQLSSAIAITETAATTTSVAGDALSQSRDLSDLVKTDRAAALEQISTMTADADARLMASDLGPDNNLVGPLAAARNQIADQLRQIHDALVKASNGSAAMAELMRNDHRYLVVAANNGEMRAGSGMFLQVGVLQTGNGSLELQDMQSVGTLATPRNAVEWPSDMEDRWGWIGYRYDLRNLMMSPRFDQSAPLAKEIWEDSGKDTVDGVLVIDPLMLQALLRATGPVEAGDTQIGADNILDQLFIEQYRSIDVTRSTVDQQAARRDELSDVARAAFSKLNQGEWNPVILAREMGSAANGRHVMVWADDDDTNARWERAGVGGAMSPNSLMLSMVNVGANKVDQFLKTEATIEEKLSTSGIDTTIRIKVTNNAPADAPRYTLGPAPNVGLASGEYSGLLSMNVPSDARSLRFDGEPQLVALGQDGPNQTIGQNIRIKAGDTGEFVVRYTRSAAAQVTVVEASGRYPATSWTSESDKWVDDAPHRL